MSRGLQSRVEGLGFWVLMFLARVYAQGSLDISVSACILSVLLKTPTSHEHLPLFMSLRLEKLSPYTVRGSLSCSFRVSGTYPITGVISLLGIFAAADIRRMGPGEDFSCFL